MKWEKLKKYLLETHEEYQDRNGLPYCKNCGVSMKELVNDVEVIIASEREKAYERGFLEGKNEWGKKVMATEISFEEAVDKHIKQAVEEYKRELGGIVSKWSEKKQQHPSYYHVISKILDILQSPEEKV